MYNGIGLSTARGSGTSGYVQKSLAFVKPRQVIHNYKEVLDKFKENPAPTKKKANIEILEHETKHKIEVQLYNYMETLKDQNLSIDEIEKSVAIKREELYADIKSLVNFDSSNDTHSQSKLKDEQMEKIKSALNIRNDYEHGTAFDSDLQEEKKQQRLVEKKEEMSKLKKELKRKKKETEKREKEIRNAKTEELPSKEKDKEDISIQDNKTKPETKRVYCKSRSRSLSRHRNKKKNVETSRDHNKHGQADKHHIRERSRSRNRDSRRHKNDKERSDKNSKYRSRKYSDEKHNDREEGEIKDRRMKNEKRRKSSSRSSSDSSSSKNSDSSSSFYN